MADQKTRKIVVSGVLSAISIVLGVTHLGLIPWFGGAAITVLHVPVIIGAILEGPVVGMIIGFLFGISSLIQAAIAPTGPIDVAFTNPMISVVPRIIIGLTTWLVYRSFNGRKESMAIISASVVGSLTNTVLVLGTLGLFGFFPWAMIGAAAVANGPLEAVAAALITGGVVFAWKKISVGKQASELPDIEDTNASGN